MVKQLSKVVGGKAGTNVFQGLFPEVERAAPLHIPEHQIHLVQGFEKQDIIDDTAAHTAEPIRVRME